MTHDQLISDELSKDGVLYLRVSDESQVKTDYDPLGNSIPAQRKAGEQRARELDITIVNEFIDPGRTAKSIEHRDAFQHMLAYLKAHRNVKYVIVYALSRAFRNQYEDAIVMVALEKLGVQLISATERNIDDTPAGRAMHGMLAVFNDYQVRANGEDIKYKMGQKVIAHGGTLGHARVGYKNVRDTSEGREIRTIAVDRERAVYVQRAFELFATGDYTEETLHATLVDMGLTMPKSAKRPERPIAKATLGMLLRDRYYLGEVKYKGVWYPGRHEPLISKELFDKVQRVLDSHSGAGTRTRKHTHYLRGVFHCARCGHRMIFQQAKGNGGIYHYYFCAGRRQDGICDQPYVSQDDLEREVLAYYATVRLTDDFRRDVASKVDETLLDELSINEQLRKRLKKRLADLDIQEDRYVDQLGEPDWPQAKLKAKIVKLRHERQTITNELANLQVNLDIGRLILTSALDLLKHPQELYRQSDRAGRRLMTLTIFGKLLVDTDRIVGHELREPFDALITVSQRQRRTYARRGAAGDAWGDLDQLRSHQPHTRNKGTLSTEDALERLPEADLLELALLDHGSNKAALVGDTGIEPVTPAV
jgi:site-specific DNA recombinase